MNALPYFARQKHLLFPGVYAHTSSSKKQRTIEKYLLSSPCLTDGFPTHFQKHKFQPLTLSDKAFCFPFGTPFKQTGQNGRCYICLASLFSMPPLIPSHLLLWVFGLIAWCSQWLWPGYFKRIFHCCCYYSYIAILPSFFSNLEVPNWFMISRVKSKHTALIMY